MCWKIADETEHSPDCRTRLNHHRQHTRNASEGLWGGGHPPRSGGSWEWTTGSWDDLKTKQASLDLNLLRCLSFPPSDLLQQAKRNWWAGHWIMRSYGAYKSSYAPTWSTSIKCLHFINKSWGVEEGRPLFHLEPRESSLKRTVSGCKNRRLPRMDEKQILKSFSIKNIPTPKYLVSTFSYS